MAQNFLTFIHIFPTNIHPSLYSTYSLQSTHSNRKLFHWNRNSKNFVLNSVAMFQFQKSRNTQKFPQLGRNLCTHSCSPYSFRLFNHVNVCEKLWLCLPNCCGQHTKYNTNLWCFILLHRKSPKWFFSFMYNQYNLMAYESIGSLRWYWMCARYNVLTRES